MKRALVIGGSGYVGRRLVETLGPERGIGTWNTHPVDGMVRFDSLCSRFSDLRRDLPDDITHVFIPFGTVNPDLCAREPEQTAATNVDSVIRVIEEVQAAALIPVFLSTDYVFDGLRGMRREDEEQCPTTEYGRQKMAVERWLQGRPGPWMIARLSKVVGAETDVHSVLGQWVNDIRSGKPMRSAVDQVFSPAHIDDIARALVELAGQGAQGIWHVAGPPCSRFELNRILVDAVREIDPTIQARVEPCSLRDIPFRELRPLNTSLSIARLQAALSWHFAPMTALAADIARQYFGRTA